jgi:hypothetical protein
VSRNKRRPLDTEYPLSGWCCTCVEILECLGPT